MVSIFGTPPCVNYAKYELSKITHFHVPGKDRKSRYLKRG